MWNTCLRSGLGGLLGGLMGNSFVFMYGSKLGVIKGSVGEMMVVISGGKTGLEVMDQEDVMLM